MRSRLEVSGKSLDLFEDGSSRFRGEALPHPFEIAPELSTSNSSRRYFTTRRQFSYPQYSALKKVGSHPNDDIVCTHAILRSTALASQFWSSRSEPTGTLRSLRRCRRTRTGKAVCEFTEHRASATFKKVTLVFCCNTVECLSSLKIRGEGLKVIHPPGNRYRGLPGRYQ